MLRLDSKRVIRGPDPKTMKKKREFLKSHDWFGHPIGFNFEGSETHNTALGGCFSILIKILMFVYIVLNIKKLVWKEDDNITTQIFFEDMLALKETTMDEAALLIFWDIKHTGDTKTEIRLGDPAVAEMVKFDLV